MACLPGLRRTHPLKGLVRPSMLWRFGARCRQNALSRPRGTLPDYATHLSVFRINKTFDAMLFITSHQKYPRFLSITFYFKFRFLFGPFLLITHSSSDLLGFNTTELGLVIQLTESALSSGFSFSLFRSLLSNSVKSLSYSPNFNRTP